MTAKSRLFQTNSGIFFYAEHNVNENGCPLHGQLLLFNLLFVRDNQSNEIPAEGKEANMDFSDSGWTQVQCNTNKEYLKTSSNTDVKVNLMVCLIRFVFFTIWYYLELEQKSCQCSLNGTLNILYCYLVLSWGVLIGFLGFLLLYISKRSTHNLLNLLQQVHNKPFCKDSYVLPNPKLSLMTLSLTKSSLSHKGHFSSLLYRKEANSYHLTCIGWLVLDQLTWSLESVWQRGWICSDKASADTLM